MKKGVVYLIGAGPGDPGLITLKGKEILESCDALVYDHLASKEFLSWVPSRCKTFYVGKQAGCHSMKQDQINELLVQLALEGNKVVRLKGGDSFVFGRGSEEILALKEKRDPLGAGAGYYFLRICSGTGWYTGHTQKCKPQLSCDHRTHLKGGPVRGRAGFIWCL